MKRKLRDLGILLLFACAIGFPGIRADNIEKAALNGAASAPPPPPQTVALVPAPGMPGRPAGPAVQRMVSGGEAALTAANMLAGLAFVSVSEAAPGWDVPPEWAETRAPWAAYGAHRDFFGIRLGALPDGPPPAHSALPAAAVPPFPVGTNLHGRVFVSPCGTVSFGGVSAMLWPDGEPVPGGGGGPLFAPLGGPMSVAPPGGSVWHGVSPSNTLVVTWRGVSLGRDPALPASAQCELWASGDFVFRVRLPEDAPDTLFTGEDAPFRTAVLNNGGGEALAWDAASLALARSEGGAEIRGRGFGFVIGPGADPSADTDGDGLTDAEEILLHRTSPLLADTDGDGLDDGDELAAGTNPLNPDTDNDLAADGIDPAPLDWDDPDACLPDEGCPWLFKVHNGVAPAWPDWYTPQSVSAPPGFFRAVVTLSAPVPAPGAVLRVGDVPLVMREPGTWVLWLGTGRAHPLTLCRQTPAPVDYSVYAGDYDAIAQTGWAAGAEGGGGGDAEPGGAAALQNPAARAEDGAVALPVLRIDPPEFCVHADGPVTFTAAGPAAGLRGAFSWECGADTREGNPVTLNLTRKDDGRNALSLAFRPDRSAVTLRASAEIGHCDPGDEEDYHRYWCGDCQRWIGCMSSTNTLCDATGATGHRIHLLSGGPFAAWAPGENQTNLLTGMSGPGARFPQDHSVFPARPRLAGGGCGISTPGLEDLLGSLEARFPGCPEPIRHFRECCGCPAHFPLFSVLPGWGPVRLASGSAALELHTVWADGSGKTPLAQGGTVPDGKLVAAIGTAPSAVPGDAEIRFTQARDDGEEAGETYRFTVMGVSLWPDTDGDGAIPHAEKEAWAATNAAWRVPAGGAPCLFELDDAILLQGYWTITLEGGASSNSAVALFGDGLAPVAVGCGESAELDIWETRDFSHFVAYEPGNYTLTVFFTGTGSATNHGAGAKLEIEAWGLKFTESAGTRYNFSPSLGEEARLGVEIVTATAETGMPGCSFRLEIVRETASGDEQHIDWLDVEEGNVVANWTPATFSERIFEWDGIPSPLYGNSAPQASGRDSFQGLSAPAVRVFPAVTKGQPVPPPFYTAVAKIIKDSDQSVVCEARRRVFVPQVVRMEYSYASVNTIKQGLSILTNGIPFVLIEPMDNAEWEYQKNRIRSVAQTLLDVTGANVRFVGADASVSGCHSILTMVNRTVDYGRAESDFLNVNPSNTGTLHARALGGSVEEQWKKQPDFSLPVTPREVGIFWGRTAAHECSHMLGLVSPGAVLNGDSGWHNQNPSGTRIMDPGQTVLLEKRLGRDGDWFWKSVNAAYLKFVLPKE